MLLVQPAHDEKAAIQESKELEKMMMAMATKRRMKEAWARMEMEEVLDEGGAP